MPDQQSSPNTAVPSCSDPNCRDPNCNYDNEPAPEAPGDVAEMIRILRTSSSQFKRDVADALERSSAESARETAEAERFFKMTGDLTHKLNVAEIMIERLTVRAGREAIAKIIDPTAWKMIDGYPVEQEHSDDALEKADAILALGRLVG